MTVDLARILLASGRLAPKQLAQAEAHQAKSGATLEEALLYLDLMTEDGIADALGRHFEIPGLALARLPKPNPRVTRILPEKFARERRIVPLEKAGDTLILLMADPTDIETVNMIRLKGKVEVQPVVASEATLKAALDWYFPSAEKRLLENVVPFVAKLITEEAARTYRVLPVDRDGSLITVAMANPDTEKTKRAIELATGLQVRPLAATWEEVERAIDRAWRPQPQPAAPAAKPAAPTAAPSAPAPAAPSPAAPAQPVQSLDSILGLGGGGGLAPGPSPVVAPAAPPPAGASLSLSFDLGLGGGAASAAPPPPPPPPPVAPAADSLSLSFDLGSVGGAAAAPSSPPAAASPGNGSLSLDGLLGAPPAPEAKPVAARPGNGGTHHDELEALALAPPASDEPAGPNLSAAGGPDGPKTGLKVEASDRQKMRELVAATWGEIDVKLGKLLPEKVARNYRVVPISRKEKQLFIAMENPKDLFAVETVQFVTGLRIEVSPATADAITAGLEIVYTPEPDEFGDMMADLEDVGLDDVEERAELDALSDLDAAHAAEAAPVVKLVNLLINNALEARASDIHVEMFEETMRVRYRVDGVLREVMRPPLALRDPVVSRLKIMGKMDISERRLPQDGRMRLRKGKPGQRKDIDFRISAVPTVHGEKIVLRILDKGNVRTDLVQLGFEAKQLTEFREAIHKPYGMCLVVGPSGSGKTNTLYSALADVNKPEVNIMTCEDPVEFGTHGLNQVQARDSIGLNFAAALRSFLRQDPNIILVGEIRDFETAEIAIKAALTGHLVLSTLHTNDAPACLSRLTNMGVEPFLIGTSLHVIVAQRLVRRICEKCKDQDERIGLDQLVQMGFAPDEARQVVPMRGKGCKSCEGTGYYGRTGLFEVMRISDEMREMILMNASQTEIKQLALRHGMRTLRMSGLGKVQAGITSCEEIIRETIG